MLATHQLVRISRTLFGVLTVALVALTPRFAAAQPAGPSEVASSTVDQVVAEIQQMRAEAGLPPFVQDDALRRAAQRQSEDMADSGRLAHVSARTGNPNTRVADEGLHPERVAENVARASTAMGAQESIVGSDAHRAQLLDPELTHLGVAAARSADGSVYLTEVMARLPVAPQLAPIDELAPADSALDQAPQSIQAEVGPMDTAPPPQLAPLPLPQGVQPAPSVPSPTLAPPPVAVPTTPGATQVAGYWVLSRGYWFYYPLPPGAQPGQQLVPDLSVHGPPPGYDASTPQTQVVTQTPVYQTQVQTQTYQTYPQASPSYQTYPQASPTYQTYQAYPQAYPQTYPQTQVYTPVAPRRGRHWGRRHTVVVRPAPFAPRGRVVLFGR